MLSLIHIYSSSLSLRIKLKNTSQLLFARSHGSKEVAYICVTNSVPHKPIEKENKDNYPINSRSKHCQKEIKRKNCVELYFHDEAHHGAIQLTISYICATFLCLLILVLLAL